MAKSKPSPKSPPTPAPKIPTWIHGCTGRMGQSLQETMFKESSPFVLTGGSDQSFLTLNIPQDRLPMSAGAFAKALHHAHLFFDFTNPDGNKRLLAGLQKGGVKDAAVLVGTTGLTTTQIKGWQDYAKTSKSRVLVAANTSLGILILMQTCRLVAPLLRESGFDIEICESHHRHKADAPSGTALLLADSIARVTGLKTIYGRKKKREADELGLSVIRGGSVFGEHTVHFLGDMEQLTFSHRALSRELFAQGAYRLGQWVVQQKPGFYGLDAVTLDTLL